MTYCTADDDCNLVSGDDGSNDDDYNMRIMVMITAKLMIVKTVVW